MKNQISKHHLELCFQLRKFFRTEHKFADLIFVDTKFFISNIISHTLSSLTFKSVKTRAENFTEESIWSQNWTIDRVDFRKTIVRLKKAVNLLSSFVDRHFRKFSKNSSNFQFVNLRLTLFDKLSQLNLADQILRVRDQQRSQISSFLSSVSSTSLSSDVFTKNSEITTSADFSNMSRFSGLSNQARSSTASSIDSTQSSIFSSA
jgi:hypothetical protein